MYSPPLTPPLTLNYEIIYIAIRADIRDVFLSLSVLQVLLVIPRSFLDLVRPYSVRSFDRGYRNGNMGQNQSGTGGAGGGEKKEVRVYTRRNPLVLGDDRS